MELLSKKELENELYYVSDEARAFMEEEVKNFNLPSETAEVLFQLFVRIYSWGHSDGYGKAVEQFY